MQIEILKRLTVADPFLLGNGNASIAVGAPHHGTRPSVKADWGTGPIALALAQRLDCPSVVVSDLRSKVDVNKDPLRMGRFLRQHAIRYQNSLFAGRPGLIIEIHGHKSGHYDIEISTGFELDSSFPPDAEYIRKLALLRQVIPASLEGRIGRRPSVGIWPLDRDVTKTATDTFTFQKIRRARHMVGLSWYGLHIEINAALRVGAGNQVGQVKQLSPQVIQALTDAFASAIQQSFEPLPSDDAVIPLHADQTIDLQVLNSQRYKVTRVPEGFVSENIVHLHPDSLHALGLLEGDRVLIRRNEEELSSQVISSVLVQKGQAGITQRMRNQVNVRPGQSVNLVMLANRVNQETGSDQEICYITSMVLHQVNPGSQAQVWLSSADLDCSGLKNSSPTRVVGRIGLPIAQVGGLDIDDSLPLRGVAISQGLASKMGITLGETFRLEQG